MQDSPTPRKPHKPLTATEVRNAKPTERPYKLWDGGGVYLLVQPTGRKYWRFRCQHKGREKLFALGVYPDISLAEAREARDNARRDLAKGVDPTQAKKAAKAAAAIAAVNTFEAIALEWFEKQKPKWTPAYADKIEARLRRNIFPLIGARQIAEITAPELLTSLRKIEVRGVHETVKRCRQDCSLVFRYAIMTGRAERDVAADLKGALHPVVTTHHAAILDPRKVGALMRAIEGYDGSIITKCALQLAPLVFVRPGELRTAEWSEIDLDAVVWKIPAAKMKMREAHIVPLCTQAVAILRKLQPITGEDRYVFPGVRGRGRPMSENTINAALRRLGYGPDEMTGHGFRAMARTILDEVLEVPPAIIEAQLAHSVSDSLGRAYNRTAYLPQRRKMMQRWADYLDELMEGAKRPAQA
jgi:integrase